MKKQIKADLLLIMITMFWGASCILTKIGLGGILEFNLIALRFTIAFSLLAIIFWKKLKNTDLKTIKYAAILSGLLFATFIFMTFGVKYTTVSNAGFLTCLAGVFIPLMTFVLSKKRPELKVIISVCLAFFGIAFLCLNDKLLFNIGDLLCILCSLTFAAHIMVTGIFTSKVDSVSLSVLQLGFVSFYSAIFSCVFENPRLPNTYSSWFVVIALSVFCTAAAFLIQTVAQKYTTSTHTGLIFSLEPVFSSIFAFFFAGEILTIRGYLGALLLICSILLVELDFKLRFIVTKDTIITKE
jgi:drug/metabolite transporter (DMT)-like permease